MFTKRHEQELAEIKALTYELGHRFQEILDELEGIKEAQDRLMGRDQQGTIERRTSGPAETQAVDGEAAESKAPGAKRARRRQAPSAAADATPTKSGKRRARTGTKSATGGSEQTAKRGASTATGSDDDAPEGGGGRKRGGGGRKRGGGRKGRQPAEPTPGSGSDQE